MTSMKAGIAAVTATLLAAGVALVLVAGGGSSDTGGSTVKAGTGQEPATAAPTPETGAADAGAAGSTPGDHSSSAAAPEGATAEGATPGAPSQTSAQKAAELVQKLTAELQQAVASGGRPQPLTTSEVEAMLRAELQRIGISQP